MIPYFQPTICDEEINEVVATLKSGWLTTGARVKTFEKNLENYLDVKHVIALNSCTAGLHLSLLSLGVKEGDEVITTPFTFAATANVILQVGARPVFVDIDKDTYNIDVNKIEEAITAKTKAIMPVHYAGQSCDMDYIMWLAEHYHLSVIEDAAHAIGTTYKGRRLGGIGDLTCFSFYATKNMTTGEGGAVATNDDSLAQMIRILSLHGISADAWDRYSDKGNWYYEVQECGWKYNMMDIQAAIGIHQLDKLDGFIRKRQEYAGIYDKELGDIIHTPVKRCDRNHVYYLYPILVPGNRDSFIFKMKEHGVSCSVHFIPLHLHPLYQRYGFKLGDYPVAESVYSQEVSLPLYPKMSVEDVMYVCKCVKECI